MKAPHTTLGKIGWGLAPFIVGGAVIFVVLKLNIWGHMANLPDGYVRSSVDDFVIYHHESDKDRAMKVVQGGRLFLKRIQKRYRPKLGDLSLPSQKVTLSLFRNHDEFREFASKSLHQDLAYNGGYFDVFKNEIALVVSDMGGVKPIEGFRHELAHLVLARGSGRYVTTMPPWLNEGLASYMETIHTDDTNNQPPVPTMFCRLRVQKAPVPPMRPIVEAHSGAFMSSGNIAYYTYSALLVRFLAKFKPARFWRYAKGLLTGKGGETFARFEATFGTQEQLQPQWKRFIRSVCR